MIPNWITQYLARRGLGGFEKGFFTHLHRAYPLPLEWTEDVGVRLSFIETYSSPAGGKRQLKLIKRVLENRLPPEVLVAWEEYRKAEVLSEEAFQAWRNDPGIYNNLVAPMEQARKERE